jgi:hypothetical protein
MGLTDDDDPYAGERYMDKDPRSAGRVVKVLEKVQDAPRLTYIVETIVNPVNPAGVGHRSALLAHTLETRFTKVSH